MPRTACDRDVGPLTHGLRDVVVVGAGISGACVAHALARTGRRVSLLDRADPAQGSTAASTALITFELDLPLHRLARSIGEEAAGAAWRHSVMALDRLRQLVQRERIACDWEERDSLYVAGNAYGHRALRAEVSMRHALGIPGEFIGPRELRTRYGIARTGAVHSTGMAVCDPVKLTIGILESTTNLDLHAQVEVTSVRSADGVVTLETNRGQVRANAVVFCTGYALLDSLPRTGLTVDSTWAICTPANTEYPAWLDTTIVWEASEPYLYLRSAPGRRLIVGGRDESGGERYADASLLAPKAGRIGTDAGHLLGLPPLEAARSWSGAFGSSESGLPVIGPVPGLPGCSVVAGFGGNGITHSMLAGELLAAQLQGTPLPFADLYHPVNTPGDA